MLLLRPAGVYRPQGDTRLLSQALNEAGIQPGADILDMCCGTGALTIAAAQTSPGSITAIDLCRRAVWATRINTTIRGIPARVEHGDAIERLQGRQFDLVLANPPYVPGIADLPTRGAARAWDAGTDGRAILDRLCAKAPELLAPGGILLTVHSALCGVDTTLRQLHDGGLKAAVVARADEPFGPVMRGRADRLRAQQLITPGQQHEELVVIRADRPSRNG
jgi:release factor glutamine methyltransferase